MALERRRVVFSGRVQGVGFRATCRWLAGGFDLAGYVRNLADGQVELLAEGEPAEIDRYVAAIRDEMGGFICNVHAELEPVDISPLEGFRVRY
jgi:acylphosphatase